MLPPVEPVLAPLLEPLHAPAPQLELPVELDDDVVLSVAVPPLAPEHDALPPEVDDDVDDSVVDAEPDDDEPPPHAERPSRAEAATRSEAFVLMFIWSPSSFFVVPSRVGRSAHLTLRSGARDKP
ncbi:MAG: hypothetical protein U0234_16335 [Sandaracinus sp.]